VTGPRPAERVSTLAVLPQYEKPSVEAYNSFVLRYTWRNLWLNAADGVLYAMGLALTYPSTILPGFINDSVARIPEFQPYRNTLVGLLGLIISACFMMPQQVWAAHITEKRSYLKRLLIFVAFLERLPWLVMGIMAALVAAGNPKLALYLFFAIVFAYQFILGIVSPVWQEAVAKMTPVNKRGLLFGVRESIGGILGAAMLLAANEVVNKVVFPRNYELLFYGMFALSVISWTTLFGLKEIRYPFEKRTRPLGEYFRELRSAVLGDRPFQRYFICQSFFYLAGIASSSFFGMRAVKVLGLGERESILLVVQMTLVVMIARAVSVFIGPLGDRFGHRLLLALANITTALGIIIALAAGTVWGFGAAYAVSTFGMMAFWCGHSNYILELAPLEKRPAYISLDNMSGLPFVVMPLVGGVLADVFKSYAVPFAIGIAFSVAGAVSFIKYAPDPRKTLRRDMVA